MMTGEAVLASRRRVSVTVRLVATVQVHGDLASDV
jgi:hypothetical protein